MVGDSGRRPWTTADEDREGKRDLLKPHTGLERESESEKVTIQQRQTPLNTYRVPLRRPLEGKKSPPSLVALSPANLVGRPGRVSNSYAGQLIVMARWSACGAAPVGEQSAGKVKAFLTGEACLRRE